MTGNFEYRKVAYKKDEGGWLIVTGEITNRSGKSYNSVVFRIILFIKNIPIGNAVLTMNGFYNGQTRTFEKQMTDLEYHKLIDKITQWEIYAESAY
jgi:proteasome assembly chaperone (PAC2) family protein